MTFAQLVAASQDSGWQSVSEALGTILLGLVAWFGRRVMRTVDELDAKFDRALENFRKHNDRVQTITMDHESRLDHIESRLPERRKRRP